MLSAAFSGAVTPKPSAEIFEYSVQPPPANQIDHFVFDRLSSIGIHPVLCSDAVFIRRAYLDVIGKLPTAEEAAEFIDTPYSKGKRSQLIDDLLARHEFADYWSMKWGDTLRIKAEFPINLWPNAAQAYHRWVRTSIAQNKPYDQFVREMLTASGSNFRVGPVNFYRALQNKTPEGIATAVALTFMGTRAETWPADRLKNLSVFFSQVGYKPTNEWKEEHVFWDPLRTTKIAGNAAPGSAVVTTAIAQPKSEETPETLTEPGTRRTNFPDGTPAEIPPDRDPRQLFADWLITPDNPWFARSIVNRVWTWLLGRGIIHEPDDIREDNPPSNPELLAWLEKELTKNHYDLKHLYRLILNSKTYQLSSISNIGNPEAEAQFAYYPLRRLDAEVLIDAINEITGTSDLYTSAIPEPFTYIPKEQPAVSIADGSITSSFLALFGRSARATGMSNERNNQTTAPQQRYLLNSGHIQKKLETGPKLRALTARKKPPEEIIQDLYLTILSRYPTEAEIQIVMDYGHRISPEKPSQPPKKKRMTKAERKRRAAKWKSARNGRMNDWVDITWALINSPEFLYHH